MMAVDQCGLGENEAGRRKKRSSYLVYCLPSFPYTLLMKQVHFHGVDSERFVDMTWQDD